jgi:RHS repeat-associated protein
MRSVESVCIRLALVVVLLTGTNVQAATSITYYHNDLLGSPAAATDASGHVIWRESYRPYGERLTNDPASGGNDVWYTSRRQDVDTGLVYMGARYYDPVVGRFVSKDPMGFDEKNMQSFNRYAYANGNPYRFLDPNGRESIGIRAQERAQIEFLKGNISEQQLKDVYEAQQAGAILGVLIDGVVSGIARLAVDAATDGLADSALVCRGGTCTAERFAQGKGVTTDAAGNLDGVSVNSANGKSLEELTTSIPNKQVGRTTVGDVRKAGGDVVPSPTANNPDHCTMCGISKEEAERLFNPTVSNPNVQ